MNLHRSWIFQAVGSGVFFMYIGFPGATELLLSFSDAKLPPNP